jgi:hypothetical protein
LQFCKKKKHQVATIDDIRNTSTIRKFSFELGNLEGEIKGLTLAIQEK